MGSSKAPRQPDPLPAAQATAQANKDVAQYTSALDRPSQIDPYGSTTWQFGSGDPELGAYYTELSRLAGLPGKNGVTDPAVAQQYQEIAKSIAYLEGQGKTYTAPKGTLANPQPGDWRQVTTLSPEQQRLYNLDVQAQEGAYGLGLNAINAARASGAGGALNMTGLPGLNALNRPNLFSAATPTYQRGRLGLPQLQGGNVGLPYLQASQTGLPQWQNLQGNVPQWAGMGSQFAADPETFAAQGQQVRDALYEQMTQFSGQRYAQEEAALRNQLANQGFAIGSEGFNRELEAFRRQKDESYRAAELNSILAGGSEQSRLFADMLSGRGQQFAESQYGFDTSMLSRQQQLYEKQAGFDAGAQTYGLDLQNRQAMQQAQMDAYNADMMNRGMTFDAATQRYGMDEATRMQNYQADMQRLNSITARQQQGFQNQAQAEQWDAMMRDQLIQERMLQRQIPMNEALAMAGMTGVTNPSYQPFNLSQPWQGIDYMGVQNQQYQGQVNQANFQNAQQGQTYGLLGALAMAGATAW